MSWLPLLGFYSEDNDEWCHLQMETSFENKWSDLYKPSPSF